MAYSQTNFLKTTGGQDTSTQTLERIFQYTDVLWAPRGGLQNPYDLSQMHVIQQLCHVKDFGTFSAEVINETESAESGKAPLSTNEGVVWTSTVQFKGDALRGIQAMIGHMVKNESSTTAEFSPALEMKNTFGTGLGDLYFFSSNPDKHLTLSAIATDVELIPSAIAGSTNGDNLSSYTVNVKGRFFQADAGFAFVPLMFYDDGTNVTNAAAPDGTLTTFDLKNANHAFDSVPTAPLLAQILDREAGSPTKYILNLRVDGTIISSTNYSFNQATGVITFNTAPADGAKIELVVLLPTGFQSYDEANVYRPGQIVKNDDDSIYYIQDGTSATTTGSFTSGDWTALTDQTFPLPYWANSPGSNYGSTAAPEFPLWSWSTIMLQ